MYYEINVSEKRKDDSYYHLFATANRSLTSIESTKKVYKKLKEAFPEPMYKITVSRWEHVGEGIDIEAELKKEQ